MTVNVASACASLIMSGTYAGTLTFTSTLTLTSTCTFVAACTIAGTAGTLIVNTGGQTITSGGKTLTCALTLGAGVTLGGNWTVTGLVTVSAGNINSNQITCNGGFRHGASNVGGTAKFVIAGGTWDSTGGNLINAVDLAGNVTVSGAISWGSGGTNTLKYVSGTITTTGSTLTWNSNSGGTLDSGGVTWNNVTIATITGTVASTLAWSGALILQAPTLSGAGAISGTGSVSFTGSTTSLSNTGGLTTTGTMTLPNADLTLAGSAGYSIGTQTTATLTASRIHTLTFGNTYTVTTALANVGTSSTIRQAIKSSSAGNKVVFKLTAGATNTLTFCDPTDVDSSGGATILSVGGTITTSLNWTGSSVAGATGAGGIAVHSIGQEGVRVY